MGCAVRYSSKGILMNSCLVDCDDLWTEQQIIDLIQPIKLQVPALKVTLYGIPNMLGPVHDLKKRYPYVTFGIHGWEHTFGECKSWTRELANVFLEDSLKMGYHPVFKPPQWLFDFELVLACTDMSVVLHHHEQFQPVDSGPKFYPGNERNRQKHKHTYCHTHIVRNPVTDFITEHSRFKPEYLLQFDEFLTPMDLAARVTE